MPASSTFDLKASDTRWHACSPDTRLVRLVAEALGRRAARPRDACCPPPRYALNAALISEGIYQSARLGRELTAEEIRKASKSLAIDPYTPEKVWK